jgi:2-oxoglutarate ferredoxin oxidoreductase subunit alpha
MSRIEAVNDFVVKFANVNGSGSASANELFARAILRMGVPVSPRNIFPSNIQGLPTWYEVRVCEAGWLGRRGGVDLMVAMNPQTWDQDVAEIQPGGYLFYDSTKPLPPSAFRPDIHVVGMPATAICNATYDVPRERTLFKNILVLGASSRHSSPSSTRARSGCWTPTCARCMPAASSRATTSPCSPSAWP